jgi:phospholipase C
MSAGRPTDHGLDHIVVVMFENRSFDNLLGYLYEPGEVPSFEGVAGRDLSNPLPVEITPAPGRSVAVRPATTMDTPDPNPGEELPHVNTQMFGTVAPASNRFSKIDDMQPPYNAPPDAGAAPPMNGFVIDYANEFRDEVGRLPSYDECAQIMTCYTSGQLPVLSTLAREFACFDHWFSEVPTETYPNRSFLHSGSSSGYVLNHPPGKFALENDAPTIFERLESAGRTWHVYIDPEQMLPATALIHARRLAPYFATHFSTTYDFYEHARTGKLADYSFIEPNMFVPHSDMHPPGAARLRRLIDAPAPEAMARGEQLLARVYGAVRDSATADGSNFENTLLLVLFDEHGGTFDHVPPPPAIPPGGSSRLEMGFAFDRSGVRVPAVAVSAWVDARTVVTQEFRHTSVIRTLRERWSLGGPLTPRDATAANIAPTLGRSTPRPRAEWPQVSPRPLGRLERLWEELDRPLSRLERDLLGEGLALEASRGGRSLDLDPSRIERREARGHMTRIRNELFPGVASGRPS